MTAQTVTASTIRDWVAAFAASPANRNGLIADERIFDAPLLGFVRGDDPVWETLKEAINANYWSPVDALRLAFPDLAAEPCELGVIAWVFPHTRACKVDSRHERALPSERWVRGKQFGQKFLNELGEHVVAELIRREIPAVVPTRLPAWQRIESEGRGEFSPWSERHVAYAAGLGTFGLCDGLITPVGKAMRCGSVVTRVKMPAAVRRYSDHHAYCLAYHGAKGCTRCIERCPRERSARRGTTSLPARLTWPR